MMTQVAEVQAIVLGSSSSSSSDDGGAAEEASSGDLATCPDPLVIQTDWFPESEHGAMYELFEAALFNRC